MVDTGAFLSAMINISGFVMVWQVEILFIFYDILVDILLVAVKRGYISIEHEIWLHDIIPF